VSRIELVLGGVFWLLLFPNAPYLITDFIHLGESHTVPMWFDILTIFTSAWAGLQFGFYSLLHVERILQLYYKVRTVHLMLLPILLFSSFGIYLGRFLRFNSWDILAAPQDLASAIWRIVTLQYRFPEALFFSLAFFAFLWVIYSAWKLSKHGKL
jgi:uncharacterized membrane protein